MNCARNFTTVGIYAIRMKQYKLYWAWILVSYYEISERITSEGNVFTFVSFQKHVIWDYRQEILIT